MKIEEIIGLAALVTILGLLIVFGPQKTANRGVCSAENRMLMDHELVDAAARELLINLKNEYFEMRGRDQLNAIVYNDLRDFYAQQPDCCEGRLSKFRTFDQQRAPNSNYVLVPIVYRHDKVGDLPLRKAEILVDACAKDIRVITDKADIGEAAVGTPMPVRKYSF